MTVDNVSPGDSIDSDWGNDVANDTNSNTANLAKEITDRQEAVAAEAAARQAADDAEAAARIAGDNAAEGSADAAMAAAVAAQAAADNAKATADNNEAARNLDFVRGSSPRVVGIGGDTSRVFLDSGKRPYIRKIDHDGSVANIGEIRAVSFDQDQGTSSVALTGSFKDISGGGVTYSWSPRGGRLLLLYSADLRCDATGTCVAQLHWRYNNSGNWNDVDDAPQIVWGGATAGVRQTMSANYIINNDSTGSLGGYGYSTIQYALLAKTNSGSFTAGPQHSAIQVLTFY